MQIVAVHVAEYLLDVCFEQVRPSAGVGQSHDFLEMGVVEVRRKVRVADFGQSGVRDGGFGHSLHRFFGGHKG